MRIVKILQWFLFFAVIALIISCGNGDNKAGRPDNPDKADKSNFTVEYERMVTILNLNDAECARLKETFKAGDEAIKGWKSSGEGIKLVQLEKQMKKAAKNRNLREMKQLIGEAKPLRSFYKGIIKTHHENILKALSPDKRKQWNAYRLADELINLMEPLGLSDDQIRQIQRSALSSIEKTINQSNVQNKTMSRAYLNLTRTMENDVLTERQRQAYGQIKRKILIRSLKFTDDKCF
jgi:pyoverdine/dityrosine biosynthesis protein Dit1